MPDKFYTYQYLREDGTAYYIGKGSNDRAFHRTKGAVRPPKDRSRVLIQYWGSEPEAFEMEKYYIRLFGRKDNGTGILRNMTDGGENPPRPKKGRKVSPWSVQSRARHATALTPEVRRKIGDASRGNTNRRGVVLSQETKNKISMSKAGNTQPRYAVEQRANALRGKSRPPFSQETRNKMSAAAKARWAVGGKS